MAAQDTRTIRVSHGRTIPVGALAATEALHGFVPDGHTGTMCLACYGWCSDPRHIFHRALPAGGAR